MAKKPFIFISYASEDKKYAQEIRDFLESYGCKVWIDLDQMEAGEEWERTIPEEIHKVDYFVFCLTKISMEKEGYLHEELQVALKRQRRKPPGKKFILPIQIDEGLSIPSEFRRLQITKWQDSNSEEQLLRAIGIERSRDEATNGNTLDPEDQNSSKSLDNVISLYKEYIENEYRSIQILGMSKPVLLKDIYIKVNILERIQKDEFAEIKDFEESYRKKERRSFGKIQETRNGLDVVKENQKLVLLGKPGAGKTTFLKHIVFNCIQENLGERMIPIFVKLKEWSDSGESLDDFIAEQFEIAGVDNSRQFVETQLKRGQCLILFDGLDEVSCDVNHAIKNIQYFMKRHYRNRIVLSCRVAAFNTIFENFTVVEIADFGEEQIKEFVSRWFSGNKKAKKKCYAEIRDNPQILELATNPLILTLLCLVFQSNEKFPSKRSAIYKETFDTLIREWDLRRGIQREQLIENFDEDNKRRLLSEIAYHTFENEDYFIEQYILENNIEQYLRREFAWPESSIKKDSRALIQSIESQHGFLVERARKVHSFSHLTFHEYLTALWIVEHPQNLDSIIERHMQEQRWREVFLLMMEELSDPYSFLISMRRGISKLANEEVIGFLQNLEGCICSSNSNPFSINKMLALVAVSGSYEVREVIGRIFEKNQKRSFDPHVEIDFSNPLQATDDEKLMQYLQSSELLMDCLLTECSITDEKRKWLEETLLIEPWDEQTKVPQIKIKKWDAYEIQERETIIIQLPNLSNESIPFEFVHIPKGRFKMGSPKNEKDHLERESPQHVVRIDYEYYLAKYPVTQAQWQAVMGENPSYFKGKPDHPVENVLWDNCQQFINKLNQLGQGTFRLPSEAEWEYACRAGTKTRFYWGEDMEDREIWNYAWYWNNNFIGGTKHAGIKKSNQWGLYDMSGNVREWCEDDWHENYKEAPQDGSAWIDSPRGAARVVRGGSWDYFPVLCRSAHRTYRTPDYGDSAVGLRVVYSRTY